MFGLQSVVYKLSYSSFDPVVSRESRGDSIPFSKVFILTQSTKYMLKKLFFLVLFASVFSQIVYSQNVNPANVNLEALSDTQIQKILTEIRRRGLSEQEAINLATAYGLSPSQINILRQRLLSSNAVGTADAGRFDGMHIDSTMMQTSSKAVFFATPQERSIFGFHLFNSENLSFEPSVNIPVSPSYVVGAGDGFTIDIYGASQQQYNLRVDKSGNLFIPNIGPVSVGGQTLASAEKRLFEKLSLIYRDLVSAQPRTFANIQLESPKSIRVNVIGEVFAPGTYSLPGTATAFNALYLSGGPNYNGSFRNIKVIRNGQEMAVLDVYDYIINGNSQANIPLHDGDVVLVPTYEKRVRVGGEFIRTGIFEGKDGETIADIIKYAGGFKEYAYKNRVELHRNNGREYEMVDLFQEMYNQVAVQTGDSIIAGRILERFANRVSINGAVFRPGVYELTSGMTLKQLIDKADGVREDAFLERGLILRLNEDLSLSNVAFNVSDVVSGRTSIDLRREDVVTITPKDSIREGRTIQIHGEVLRPGEIPYRDNMTLEDAIILAGGLKESASDASIEVTRRLSYEEATKYGEANVHLYQFNISRLLTIDNTDAGFKLSPFDHIYIRRAPGFAEGGLVNISGEVILSGQYGLTRKNERLSEVIKRAGGLTPDAYAEGAMLTRRVELSAKARRLREELKKSVDGIEYSELGFEVVGVNLAKAIEKPGSRDDIILHNGDELVVPRKLLTVNVEGEVLNPITVPFVERRSLRYYVNQGGGFAMRAKKNKAYVIYPNGSSSATRNFVLFNNYPVVKPGSQIIIPQRPERERLSAAAWISIGSGISSLALTIITIVNATK